MLEYLDKVQVLLSQINTDEEKNIKKAAEIMSCAIARKSAIYVFGASHAGILAEEMFYRAGGLMPINPIFGAELALSTQPIMTTSRMERLEGYGVVLAQKTEMTKGDVLIVHSVSGRNPVSIDLALTARDLGVKVIGIVNLKYSSSVTSKHSSGKRLFEICDVVIDNHGDIGDAVCTVDGLEQKVGPTSTATGAVIVNCMLVETVKKLRESGMDDIPVFYSANLDGGDERNRMLFEKYKDSIKYKL